MADDLYTHERYTVRRPEEAGTIGGANSTNSISR